MPRPPLRAKQSPSKLEDRLQQTGCSTTMNDNTDLKQTNPNEVELARERTKQATVAGWTGRRGRRRRDLAPFRNGLMAHCRRCDSHRRDGGLCLSSHPAAMNEVRAGHQH